jgi:hypothetical protein
MAMVVASHFIPLFRGGVTDKQDTVKIAPNYEDKML